jgi:hypothetical protein
MKKTIALLVPLAIGAIGAMVVTLSVLWAEGRDTSNIGAIVAVVGTALTVVGWYTSTRLQADAQTALLHFQLLNEGRRLLVRVLHGEQERLRTCMVRLHVLRFSDPVTPELRTNVAQTLKEASNHPTATDWIFALEEHQALFPEVRTARLQLLIRSRKLFEKFRRFVGVLEAANPLPRQFDAAVTELESHLEDQAAMLQDLATHIQNRAFGEVSGHRAENRRPPDDRVPRLVMSEGQLVVHVPDATRRVQMEVAGWLPPRNPPGS